MRTLRTAAAACLVLLSLAAGQAVAEPVYAITVSRALAGPVLVSFDSATPGAMSIVAPFSGLVQGQTLNAIDFRPATGQLYAVSSNTTSAQLYTVNLVTGALTTVGSTFAITNNQGGPLAIDFNPVVDRLRVVTGSGANYRINPTNGTIVGTDTPIDQATFPYITGLAYSNNVPGAASTTLYAYDFTSDTLDTIGNVGGTPNSPNSGKLFVVGMTGLLSALNVGLDISGGTGLAYASVVDSSPNGTIAGFYAVDLGTGLFTLIGSEAFELLDIAVAVVPEPDALAILALGLAALVVTRRRPLSSRARAA